jgi:hypothetical protein
VTQRVDFLAHGAGVADDAPRPVEHALTLRGEALKARAAVDQQHAHLFFEVLHPAESVGWVTPQASAARPKCFSRARARMKSSLSITDYPFSSMS